MALFDKEICALVLGKMVALILLRNYYEDIVLQ